MIVVYCIHMAVLPLLLTGFVRCAKARLQGRLGPPLLQPFHDLAKLLRKGETVSATRTWIFRAAPVVQLASVASVALMVPWIGLPSPIDGDLFLAIYLLALARFAAGLAALDGGSAFGGLGASRSATVAVEAEPALVLALGALAGHAHSSRFSAMLAPSVLQLPVLMALIVVAMGLAVLAMLARMPFDDPTTHLELTMIHETLVLENSGPTLALVEYSAALEMAVLLGLTAQVARMGEGGWAATMGVTGAAAMGIVLAETVLVKMRWRRIPNLLSFAVSAAVLACLLVALAP